MNYVHQSTLIPTEIDIDMDSILNLIHVRNPLHESNLQRRIVERAESFRQLPITADLLNLINHEILLMINDLGSQGIIHLKADDKR